MDISATFRLTAREYRRAQRNAPGMRGVYIGFALITVVCLVGLALKEGPGIWLYVGLGLPLYVEVIIRRATSKSAALLAEPWVVRVTDETLTLRNAVRQAEVGWNAYSEAWERSGFWYLREISGRLALSRSWPSMAPSRPESPNFSPVGCPRVRRTGTAPAPGDKSGSGSPHWSVP